MTDLNEALGTIEKADGCWIAHLQRELEHPPAQVWAMLTEPAKFVEWLAPGEIELKKGGKARLDFVESHIVIDSEVSVCVAGQSLEYSWSGPGEPERPVRWDLIEHDGGTLLNLTLTTPEGEDAARSCAGWEAHLMMLLAAIEGVPIKFPFERFQSTRAEYGKMLTG